MLCKDTVCGLIFGFIAVVPEVQLVPTGTAQVSSGLTQLNLKTFQTSTGEGEFNCAYDYPHNVNPHISKAKNHRFGTLCC